MVYRYTSLYKVTETKPAKHENTNILFQTKVSYFFIKFYQNT